MTCRLISAVTAVLACALLVAGPARAQDGGGFDPCAGLKGAAFGLCEAYNEHMGCSSDTPQAAQAACDNVAQAFEQDTGFPPPSDCPCDFSPDRVREPAEEQGWDLSADFFCEIDEVISPASISTELFNLLSTRNDAAAADLTTGTFGCVYNSTVRVETVVIDETDDSVPPEELDYLYQACKGAVIGLADSINVTCQTIQ